MDINEIIGNKDREGFLKCLEEDFEDCFISLRYDFYDSMDIDGMNEVQQTIYLCSLIDDACQADTIINFWSDDETGERIFLLPRAAEALENIKAYKSAEALKELIARMPEGTFENRVYPCEEWLDSEENFNFFMKTDRIIGGYPDGRITDLCRDYVMGTGDPAGQLLENV